MLLQAVIPEPTKPVSGTSLPEIPALRCAPAGTTALVSSPVYGGGAERSEAGGVSQSVALSGYTPFVRLRLTLSRRTGEDTSVLLQAVFPEAARPASGTSLPEIPALRCAPARMTALVSSPVNGGGAERSEAEGVYRRRGALWRHPLRPYRPPPPLAGEESARIPVSRTSSSFTWPEIPALRCASAGMTVLVSSPAQRGVYPTQPCLAPC